MAFVKLDCGMLDSTLWLERECREVFITALLMAEPREVRVDTPQIEVTSLALTGWNVPPGWYGFVPAAGVGILRRASIPEDAGFAALEKLGSPDLESRSADYDGRRLVRVDGGFIILNYMKYRDRDYTAADRQKRLRERKKTGETESRRDVTTATGGERNGVTENVTVTREVTHSREQSADKIKTASSQEIPLSPESDEKAGGEKSQVNNDDVLRILVECKRAGLDSPDPDNPIIARWIRHAVTPTLVAIALLEATRARDAPKPLTAAYVDPIVERVTKLDRKTRSAANRRTAETQALIAEQKARPAPGPVPAQARKFVKRKAEEPEREEPEPTGRRGEPEAALPPEKSNAVTTVTETGADEVGDHWWADPEQVSIQGEAHDVRVIAGQPWDDYVARVFAAMGPGEWLEAAELGMRERVQHFLDVGINPPLASSGRPQPIQRGG